MLWPLIGIIVLALGLRAGVALATRSWDFPSEKGHWAFGHEMGLIAASIANGDGFCWPESAGPLAGKPTAWMPPVYPYVMAAAFRTFGTYSRGAAVALFTLQSILSALTCLLLYALGKRIFSAPVGLMAATMLAVYPAAVHFSVQKTWSTSLFTFCLVSVLYLFLRAADRPNKRIGFGLGLLMGFTTLVNPLLTSVYLFALIWLLSRSPAPRCRRVHTVGAIVVGMVLCITPWLLHNYVVFGEFVFTKSNLGNELFKGNNAYATGDLVAANRSPAKVLSAAERDHLKSLDEATVNRILMRKAIAYITAHPGHFLKLTARRFVLYWTYMRTPQGLAMQLSLVAYFFVLTAALLGLTLCRPRGRDVQLILIFFLVFPLPYYFTIVGLFRYRFPLEPLIMIFAGLAVWSAVSGLYTRRVPATVTE